MAYLIHKKSNGVRGVKGKLLMALLSAVFVIILVASPVQAAPAQWENFIANDDSGVHIYGVNWSAQTFTTGAEAHTVTQVRLKLYREGTCGTITVSIRATLDGAPNGSDLTSGTINADNSITTTATGVWYGIDVTPYSLVANTKYAIVVRNLPGTATTVDANWRMDGSAGSYTGGSEWLSTNGGISWTADTDDDYMFEVWGEKLIAVYKTEVYRGFVESEDLLFAIHYLNAYVPYYPDYDPARYFYVQLRASPYGVNNILAQTVCRGWGNKPAAIYLSANQAAALSWGTPFRIYLYGDFTDNPSAYYTLQAGDWRGTDLSSLDAWVLLTAHSMESYYNITITTFISGKGECLNEEGGIIFDQGIPGLSTVRPNLFQAIVHKVAHADTGWTYAFRDTSPEEILGSGVMGAADNFAGKFGVAGKDMLGFIFVFVYIIFGIFLVASGHVTSGIVVGFPILLIGAYCRCIDIVLVGAILSVIIFLGIWSLWWSKT